jgi:two-component system response regulator MprA
LLAFGDLTFDVQERTARRGELEIPLSGREAGVLELLLRNPRQIVTRDVVLDRVWGDRFTVGTNVVDRYVSYLRRKLGEPQLIHTVRGVGFRLDR